MGRLNFRQLSTVDITHTHGACAGLVHRDLKPHNVVKVAIDDSWKLIDMASCGNDGKESPIDYTLRYAAPEVVQAEMSGKKTSKVNAASDMWSLGVIMYELYTGKRLFDDSMPEGDIGAELCNVSLSSIGLDVLLHDERIGCALASHNSRRLMFVVLVRLTPQLSAAWYHQPNEMKLRGLQNVDANAARFIRKLLVKDPAERWSAHKALHSQFFRIMDDTTKTAITPTAVAAAMHNLSSECAEA
eukprot:1418030-Pyramimonas_sp.AAC.2